MPDRPLLTLNRQRHRSLSGHLWIYRNEIESVAEGAVPGDVVEIREGRGKAIGLGYWNPASQITVRLLTRQVATTVDAEFWRARLRTALALRARVLPGDWPARRLVNSEADLLPGLIVDQYGDHVVFQLTTLGMDRWRDTWIEVLRSELRPAALVERSDMPVRTLEGVPARAGYVHGSGDGAVTCRVNRATFAFNLLDPHKTGFYLDQQANYGLCARHLTPGGRVLDAFCHLGGFAIHAALAGAGEVIAVDQAEESIAGARAAAALSGCPAIDFRCGNAFDVLKNAQTAGERFDLIVLDPPTFTRTRAAVPGALRGYKEIHLRALRMLPVGGRLATFSCSHHVDAALFLETIVDAAADAGVLIRLEERLGASPDHPVLPAVPETEYLKGFVFSVVEARTNERSTDPLRHEDCQLENRRSQARGAGVAAPG